MADDAREFNDRAATLVARSGPLDAPAAAALLAALDARTARLDLGALDPAEPAGVAVLAAGLREAARRAPLVVIGAPQMLAHTLYKLGALGPRLRLEAPRDDEQPYPG